MKSGRELFDGEWLGFLAEALREETPPGFLDLYLERRLEICLDIQDGILQMEESRSEGAALRSATRNLQSLQAATGIGPRPISTIVEGKELRRKIARLSPRKTEPLNAPDGWRERIEAFLEPMAEMELRMRILCRSAAVVLPKGVEYIAAPTLLRLEFETPHRGRLLSVWDHPDLLQWRSLLLQTPPRKTWQPPAGESFPILLGAASSGVLFHEIAGHLLEGDILLHHPLSPDSQGALKAPLSLKVIDDPTRMDLPGAFSCDDEGVVARPRTLIEGGRIRGALCDRKHAEKLGRNPGRGRRARWNTQPQARMSNIIIEPGKTEPDDMENELRKGLLITRIGGASLDPSSGRVQLEVEAGWELRRGRRRRALAPCLLGATVQQIFGGIRPDIGCDRGIDWRLGWCLKAGVSLPTGSEGPSILIESMEVM